MRFSKRQFIGLVASALASGCAPTVGESRTTRGMAAQDSGEAALATSDRLYFTTSAGLHAVEVGTGRPRFVALQPIASPEPKSVERSPPNTSR
ncbi:MAG: hypothetical protein ACRDJN_23335 [Chloroflexota bacterium]